MVRGVHAQRRQALVVPLVLGGHGCVCFWGGHINEINAHTNKCLAYFEHTIIINTRNTHTQRARISFLTELPTNPTRHVTSSSRLGRTECVISGGRIYSQRANRQDVMHFSRLDVQHIYF